MSAITIIIDLVLILVSLILIVTVLLQQGQRQGLGAIGGGAETFFGKNKAKSYEGKLALLTKVCAAVFIVLAIIATILAGNKDTKTNEDAAADTTAEPAATDVIDVTEEPATTDEADTTAEPEATPETEPTAAPEATVEPEATTAA